MAILPQPASLDEKLKEFDSVPLFMRSLPSDDVDDTAISALQSLAHEGTPDEIAQNFKEHGNEYFKGKRYREALGFYSQGIDAKPEDSSIVEALLSNRAACNLALQNYGSVLRDCSRVVTLNPKSSKGLYRSALALMSLDRLEEALDACDRCLSFDTQNNEVKALRISVLRADEAKKEKQALRLQKLKEDQEKRNLLREAFRERGLIDLPHPSGTSHNNYEPRFDDESDASKTSLIIPIMFLYPQYAQSDMVPSFCEDTTFGDQLNGMFPPNAPPPEWDARQEYVVGRLGVYAITHNKRLLRVGMRMTLRDLCNVAKMKDGIPDGLEIRDGCLTIVVLPKGEAEQGWVNEFKSSRGRTE